MPKPRYALRTWLFKDKFIDPQRVCRIMKELAIYKEGVLTQEEYEEIKYAYEHHLFQSQGML